MADECLSKKEEKVFAAKLEKNMALTNLFRLFYGGADVIQKNFAQSERRSDAC